MELRRRFWQRIEQVWGESYYQGGTKRSGLGLGNSFFRSTNSLQTRNKNRYSKTVESHLSTYEASVIISENLVCISRFPFRFAACCAFRPLVMPICMLRIHQSSFNANWHVAPTDGWQSRVVNLSIFLFKIQDLTELPDNVKVCISCSISLWV